MSNAVADPDLQMGVGGRGHPDPEIGGGSLKRIFSLLFGPQFGLKIRGRGGQAPPGPSPGSSTVKDETNLNSFKSALTSS